MHILLTELISYVEEQMHQYNAYLELSDSGEDLSAVPDFDETSQLSTSRKMEVLRPDDLHGVLI